MMTSAAACSSSRSGGVTGPSPAAFLNLAGNWSGTVGDPGTDEAMNASWTATQNGAAITGPFTLQVRFSEDAPLQPITGILAGTISGTQLALTLTFPTGTFTWAGAPSCSVSATGLSTPTASALSASMAITFSTACIGTIADEATDTDQLSLTKS
jgi:hypothetical protein